VLLAHANASQPKTLVRFNLQVYCTVDGIYCVPPKLLLFVVTQLTVQRNGLKQDGRYVRQDDGNLI
jgi:hypothetical protein